MTVAGQPFLVAQRLRKGLADGDADILHGVMAVDVQVTGGFDVQIEAAMTGDLIEHVVEETDTGVELALARAVPDRP